MPIRFVYMTIALKSIPNTYCFPDKEIRAIPVVPIFIPVGRITGTHACNFHKRRIPTSSDG